MLHCQDQRHGAVLLFSQQLKRGGKESLFRVDEDGCNSLLHPATDAANPCLQESLHPHYQSIDFSSPPTEQDTALDSIVEEHTR